MSTSVNIFPDTWLPGKTWFFSSEAKIKYTQKKSKKSNRCRGAFRSNCQRSFPHQPITCEFIISKRPASPASHSTNKANPVHHLRPQLSPQLQKSKQSLKESKAQTMCCPSPEAPTPPREVSAPEVKAIIERKQSTDHVLSIT